MTKKEKEIKNTVEPVIKEKLSDATTKGILIGWVACLSAILTNIAKNKENGGWDDIKQVAEWAYKEKEKLTNKIKNNK